MTLPETRNGPLDNEQGGYSTPSCTYPILETLSRLTIGHPQLRLCSSVAHSNVASAQAQRRKQKSLVSDHGHDMAVIEYIASGVHHSWEVMGGKCTE